MIMLRDAPCRVILDRIAGGENLISICRDPGLPSVSAFLSWCKSDPDLADAFEAAKQVRLWAIEEEVLEVSDDEDTETTRAKLRVDSRKWMLSKRDPLRFGDRTAVTGGDGGPVQIDSGKVDRRALAREILFLVRDGVEDAQVIEGD